MKRGIQLIWLMFIVVLFVGACGQNEEETPPAPTATTAVTAEIAATDTAVTTPAPTATPLPTNTAVPQPTATSEPTVAPTATTEPTPQKTELFIDVLPTAFIVGQETTIEGRALPAPAENVIVRVFVAGGEDLVLESVPVDADSGAWTAAITIPPEIVGMAEVAIYLESEEMDMVSAVEIQPDTSSEEPYIDVFALKPGGTAVIGRTIIFEGVVNQPIDETVTISILDSDCSNNAASQSFSVSGGPWVGLTIISANAQPGPACAVALTGSLADGNGREYRTPITLIPADDPEAIFLEVGLTEEIEFTAGQSTNLFGIAINEPENEVMIKLESADPSRPSEIITSGSAYADIFGFWEIDLEIPEDAAGSALLIITSGNNDENYREISIPVTIQQ